VNSSAHTGRCFQGADLLLETEIRLSHAVAVQQLPARSLKHDTTSLQHVGQIRKAERKKRVLLHEDDGQSPLMKTLHDRAQHADQQRRQTQGRLVQQKELASFSHTIPRTPTASAASGKAAR
jgi:hypothetical protein